MRNKLDERLDHKPPVHKVAPYVVTALIPETKTMFQGNASQFYSAAAVVMLALKNAPSVQQAALGVYDRSVQVAVNDTRKAIFDWVEKTALEQYWDSLPPDERAKIVVKLQKKR